MLSALKKENEAEAIEHEHVVPTTKITDEAIPDYMKDVYEWAYVSDKNADLLDNPLTVSILLFLQDKRLLKKFLSEIEPGCKMMMMAHVYGPMVERIANHVGKNGIFHLVDVTPVQVRHALKKLRDMKWAQVWQEDAATAGLGDYDIMGSFFLLHEVPDDKKTEIIDNMLNHTRMGGKSVYIDYANPKKWQPIRYILAYINKHLEPFAPALWKNSIQSFATAELAKNFEWSVEPIFGGVYQKVVAKRVK
ncbi:MAG: rhodoquinone biosynthesis methyltransferase RquA [Alphaproteobacteria bacterium]